MANKQMTPNEVSLFAEMRKLANRTNARIRKLRKLTEIEEPFSTKQLADKLSADTLNAWTKSGYVGTKKGTELQMKAINKAMKEFLSEKSISTTKKVKAYQKKISAEMSRPVSIEQANTVFQARKDYKWIYEYMEASDYWPMVEEAKQKNWTSKEFTEEILKYIVNATVDEDFKKDLEDLYYYSLYGD